MLYGLKLFRFVSSSTLCGFSEIALFLSAWIVGVEHSALGSVHSSVDGRATYPAGQQRLAESELITFVSQRVPACSKVFREPLWWLPIIVSFCAGNVVTLAGTADLEATSSLC